MGFTKTSRAAMRAALGAWLVLAAGTAFGAWGLVGDINGDGLVDFGDINPFVDVLTSGKTPPHVGPIGYWPLDASARDFGAYERHGRLAGDAVFSSDAPPRVGIGHSLCLDGADDYVELGSGLLGGPAFDQFTFEAWFRTDGVFQPQWVQGMIFSDETTDGEFNVFIDPADGRVKCTIYTVEEGGLWLYGPEVTDNLWHHVALRLGATEATLFADGKPVDSCLATPPLRVNGQWQVAIGTKYTDEPKEFFQGLVDEVKVHDRALCDAAIAHSAGLVAAWEFDECAGAVAADSSGNHLDGTVIGAAWVASGDGCALSFNGLTDYVDLGRSLLAGPPLGQFTFETWIQTDGVYQPGWSQPMIFSDETTDGEFNVFVDPIEGTLKCTVYTVNEGGFWLGGPAVTDNMPHHVALRLDNVAATLFVDGKPCDARTATPPLRVNGEWRAAVGAKNTDEPKEFFQGVIDEPTLYSYPRSDEEIAADAGVQ